MKKNLLFILLVILLFECKQKPTAMNQQQVDSTLTIQYAKGFSIDYFKDYKRVTVINPWKKNSVYARYYLVSNDSISAPEDGQKIIVPLKSIGAASNTHFEFLCMINELGSITGICSHNKIYNPIVLKKLKQGKLTDMGDSFSLNFEKVQLLQPEVVMVSGFNQEDVASKRLIENGIPVLFNNEWMETSLLARAEWLKFVAVFYNKESLADSIFTAIVNNYQANKNKSDKVKTRPTIMVGGNFKGTWYMPGGNSYMAGLIADAGGDYFYKSDTTSGSLPLNFEVALNNFKNADIWIGSSANNLDELLSIDERHGLFKSANNKQVYNFNNRTTPTGGNDFWESGIAHPDIILADMIKVFHPEIMKEHEFIYVSKLK